MYSQISKDYLVATIGAVLRQDKVPEPPKELDFKEFYRFAKFHCVENIVYHALEQIEIEGQEELLAKWAQNRDGNIFKLMTQLGELERLSAAFEEMKIKHLPLKGALLVDIYPQFDFRYLGDLDILFEEKDLPKVFEFMESQGYKAVEEDFAIHHTDYSKTMNGFEMMIEVHNDLVEKHREYYELYEEPWSNLQLENVTNYRYKMSLEDFYIFLLVHLVKHYYNSGTGIRSIMDIYVFLNAYGEQLNYSYIDQKLDLVGLKEFRDSIEQVTMSLFEGTPLPEKLIEMAERLLSHGAFGDRESFLTNQLENGLKSKRQSKIGYIASRIFLPRLRMEGLYPIIKKHPYLLPYFWCHRVLSRLFNKKNRKNLKQEISRLKKFDKK